jgi:hypothetical protein
MRSMWRGENCLATSKVSLQRSEVTNAKTPEAY